MSCEKSDVASTAGFSTRRNASNGCCGHRAALTPAAPKHCQAQQAGTKKADIGMTPKKLTAARKELDLGPVQMSRAMGVTYETFSQWESGRRKMPAVAIRCVELLL
ncbi:MAG: helix-turn-helix transcriptional regulator, partial [Woeseia sp.]